MTTLRTTAATGVVVRLGLAVGLALCASASVRAEEPTANLPTPNGVSMETATSQPGMVVVHPQDNGSVPVNPGMGWVLHYYDNSLGNYGRLLAPEDLLEDYPGFSVVYLRLAWCYIEPRPGQFDWSVVDGPAQRFIAAGKKVAFRFSCCEGHSNIIYAAPQWLEQEGAEGVYFKNRHGKEQGYWEPVYNDPVFLKYLDRFLAEAAKRYDGDPNVAFVDVGSYGIWGEGHTFHSTKSTCTPEMVDLHVGLHAKHFKKTLLAINDDLLASGYREDRAGAVACAQRWADQGRFTLRDDSILVHGGDRAYRSADFAQPFWPVAPVILESEHYGGSKARGDWGDGSKYEECMEVYHASYASIHWWPREFLGECRELVDRMNRRLGYRLWPRQLTWPAQVAADGQLTLGAEWVNTAVAPCYGGGYPALTLKTPAGGVMLCMVDQKFNVRDLPVAPAGLAKAVQERVSFRLPANLAPGRYDVFLSIGSAMGTPEIAMPIDGEDGQRRYRVGSIEITPAVNPEEWLSGKMPATSAE